MTSVHVHIYSITHGDTRGYFIKPLTNIFDFSELANKQTNYELKNIYTCTHIAEMNIFIDNTL